MPIQKNIDTGDVLLQKKINIEFSSTTGEILEELSLIGADLIIETLEGLSNNIILPKKQDDKYASFAPKISNKLFIVSFKWSMPLGSETL